MNRIKSSWETCKELGPLGPLMLFAILTPAIGVLVLLSSSSFWFPLLESLNQLTLPVYIFLTIILAGLSLIPTHASSLVGGMLFGVIKGPVFALCAIVGAAYFSFLLIRLIAKESSYKALLKRPQAAKIHEELLTRSGLKSVLFIALIRFSPVMPFAGTNVLLAASKVKTSLFLLGSFIGLAPRVILVAITGAGLSELDLSKSSNIWLLVLGGLATVFLIVYIGKVIKKVNRNLYSLGS